MAAVGLPCWTPGVWADTVWALGVWQDQTTPPPPPVEDADVLSGGWQAQVARWRGWQAPPRRQPQDEDAAAVAGSGSLVPGSQPETTNQQPETAPALLATATVLPLLDWAPLLTLAQADQARRQALVQAGEEEELLVLLMLLGGC